LLELPVRFRLLVCHVVFRIGFRPPSVMPTARVSRGVKSGTAPRLPYKQFFSKPPKPSHTTKTLPYHSNPSIPPNPPHTSKNVLYHQDLPIQGGAVRRPKFYVIGVARVQRCPKLQRYGEGSSGMEGFLVVWWFLVAWRWFWWYGGVSGGMEGVLVVWRRCSHVEIGTPCETWAVS
jgi:hypothetical protein